MMPRSETDLYDHYAQPPVGPAAVDRLNDRIAELDVGSSGRQPWVPAAAAIAVVILIGGGAAALQSHTPPTPETAATTPPATASATSVPSDGPGPTFEKITLQRLVDLLPRPGTLTNFVDLSRGNLRSAQVVYNDRHGAAEILIGTFTPTADSTPAADLPCGERGGFTCSTLPDGTAIRVHQGPEYPHGRTPNATSWSVDILRPGKVFVPIAEWNAPTEKGSPPTRAQPPFTISELTTIATSPTWTTKDSPDLIARAATLDVPNR